MIINSSEIAALDDAAYPVIGYDNVVTISNVVALSSDADHPVVNLANPATNLRWQGATAGANALQITVPAGSLVDYLAIAEHNLGTSKAALNLIGYTASDYYTKSLLHFNGSDGATTFADETGKTWTAAGNAQIDQAYPKLGIGSLLLDGTGDYINTPHAADWVIATGDFTVEMWIKPNVDGSQIYPAGQVHVTGGAHANTVWFFSREVSNVVNFNVVSGVGITTLSSTTLFTVASGWQHIRGVRLGNTLKLFVNGVQEGGTVAYASTINTGTGVNVAIGRAGDYTAGAWNGWIDEFRFSVGVARDSGLAFTPATTGFDTVSASPVAANDSFVKSNLLFDGADGSTYFKDETGKPWTATSLAYIDTSDAAEGSALYLEGSSDWITTPDHIDFTLGTSEFTIEAWFKTNKALGTFPAIAGQGDSTFSGAGSAWLLLLIDAGTVRFHYNVGGSTFTMDGTTVFSNTVNPGWHHVAITRSGNVFRMFVDGVQEATVTNAVTINNVSTVVTIGGLKDYGGLEWLGWIDNFKLSVGTARYTANFTPPERVSRVAEDNTPIIWRFTPSYINRVILFMDAGDVAPRVSVLYVGKLLVLERSVRIDTTHTPINMGRKSNIATGRSENGKFLGRIVLGQWNQGQADFAFFTNEWYRTYFKPFVDATDEIPFFFAWSPQDHPEDVGYVWMTEDPIVEVNTVVDRFGISIKYQGIV